MAGNAAGRAIAALIAVAFAGSAPADPPETAPLPEPPRATVEVPPLEVTGQSIRVEAGGDLNAALAEADRGDEIVLTAGAVYRGPFELPAKPGDGWITIRSDATDALPAGERVTPDDADKLAVLEAVSGHAAVVSAAPGASGYRLVGLEIRPAAGEFLHNVVAFGRGDETEAELPTHLVLERSWVHGDPEAGARRGVALNSRYSAVIDSTISDIKELGADSQAIGGWNGPGPYRIANNTLEGAGENLMFGGATAAIDGLVPSDIEIVGNLFTKPLSWWDEHPTFAGKAWAVKNLLELKNARRVLIDGNVFEHSWPMGQTGFAVLFTVRNEGGRMPWAAVHDVTFTNNLVRHAGSGINVLGADTNGRGDDGTRRILVANNRFVDIGGDWGDGRLFQLLNGTDAVVIRDNSASQTGSIVVSGGKSHTRFVFAGNAAPHNRYGIVGSGSAPGLSTLSTHFPGAVVARNVIAGGSARLYPDGNEFRTGADGGVDETALCRALHQAEPMPSDVAASCQGVGA